MAEKVMMTALSPTMEEGTIVSWKKSEGDTVSSGDLLCEVETDKATMDYEATQEGTLLKIVCSDGSSASVGQTIAIIGDEGEDVSELVKEAENEGSGGSESEDSGSAAAVPDATKAEVAAAAGSAGQSASPPIDSTKEGPADVAPSSDGDSSDSDLMSGPQSSGVVKASPLARKLASERGLDIARIPGTGPGGRIVKSDVEGYVPTSPGVSRTPAAAAVSATAVMQPGENQNIPVTGKRAVVARRLAESKFSAPHYYLKNSVKMDDMLAARAGLNREVPEKVSLNAFLLKFAAEALNRHPQVNASWQGDQIVQFGSIDIGLAVDLGNGLITPIVRNCGNKGVVTIDQDLKALIAKAGENKLAPQEYTGATFTISNLGSFGVEEFTAIINPPGSAILAIGETKKTVVVNEDDEIDVAQIMKMTLSCDHRVIDGATGGRFLFDLKRIMESPIRALY